MIQIDMPMPKNCLDCPACNEYLMCAIPVNGRKWGENDVREFGQGRPEWCPLKEQEVKTGYWIDSAGNDKCSICGEEYSDLYPDYGNTHFCPNCGAKMEGR